MTALRTATPRALPGDDLSRRALRAAESPGELRAIVEELRVHPQIRGLAAKLARGLDGHGADDLLQGTLERVVRGIGSYRGTGDLLGWVSRIMRNAQVEILRRSAREQARDLAYRNERAGDHQADPADLLGERQLREVVLGAWQRISADADVRLFWDRVYVGLSVDQLVRRTGRPRSTVYLMLQRGGAKLAREVKRVVS